MEIFKNQKAENILEKEQFINKVSLDLYLYYQMLSQAIEKLKKRP
jgi:transcription-repair coupling factor (superfamily II helicase)